MKSWKSRPKELALGLNPAFCCTILTTAISGYTERRVGGIPFPIIFMIPPIVLHKATRGSLPRNVRFSMAAWLQEYPQARLSFYERLMSLKPYVREALHFGMLRGWIIYTSGGLLESTLKKKEIDKIIGELIGEARDCGLKARFVGRWLAEAGPTNTAMQFWGISP